MELSLTKMIGPVYCGTGSLDLPLSL